MALIQLVAVNEVYVDLTIFEPKIDLSVCKIDVIAVFSFMKLLN